MKGLRSAALLAVAASCSSASAPSPKAVRGPDAPRFERAASLLSAARVGGVSCVNERAFNPMRNVAADAIDYPAPDGRVCDLPSGEPLYVIVYDTLPHRIEAVEHGEAQLNLCSFGARTRLASDSWNALVAANWRAATPGSAQTLADLRAGLGGAPEPETLSCQFRS